MKLELDSLGMVPATYPKKFYRLTTWATGRYVADYDSLSEAKAASYASKNGTKYDHKVSTMEIR